MVHITQKRVGALLAAALLSLALLAVFAVAAQAIPPLVQHEAGVSGNPPTYRATGVRPDSGPLGDRAVAIAGRNRIPEFNTGSTSTTWVVFGLLAAVLLVITGATVAADRRLGEARLAAAGAPARAPVQLRTGESPDQRRKAA